MLYNVDFSKQLNNFHSSGRMGGENFVKALTRIAHVVNNYMNYFKIMPENEFDVENTKMNNMHLESFTEHADNNSNLWKIAVSLGISYGNVELVYEEYREIDYMVKNKKELKYALIDVMGEEASDEEIEEMKKLCLNT